MLVRMLAAASTALLLFALAGCGDGGGPAPDEQRAGGSIRVALGAEPTTLLPPLATAAVDGELGAVLYLGLNYAEWEGGALRYPPGHALALARDWDIDGSSLTYRLDTTRRWSDGRPIVARDVVFTYDLLREAGDLPMSVAAARVDSVIAVDDSTAVFHFDASYPGMLYDTGVGIIPAHVFGGLDPDAIAAAFRSAAAQGAGPVVSGAFRVARWEPGGRLELQPNPEGPVRPRADRIVFVVLPDPATRLSALRAGELDLVQVESYRDATELSRSGEYQVLRVPQRGYDYIAWNPAAHPAFADRNVRRALSLAVDREAILAALDMRDFAEKAYGPYGSIFADLAPPPPDGGDFDPETARDLLDAGGWTDPDGDGILDRDGRSLTFQLGVPAGNERRMDAAQLLQAQLLEIGVRIDIESQEFNSLFARARARDYEAVFLGWQVGLDPDISFFWADPASPVNVASYDGPEAAGHIRSALAATTAAEAAPHWREAARLIAGDYPFAFLWYFDFVWLASERLADIRMDPVGFLRNPHEWSVRAPG